MRETLIQSRIRAVLNKRGSPTRVWRNNVGAWKDPETGRWIHYGLCTGSGDLIGLKRILITPDIVGRELAVFLSAEVKRPTKDLEDHQRRWAETIQKLGGIAVRLRTEEEAEALISTRAL